MQLKATEAYAGNLRAWVTGDKELFPYISVKIVSGDVETLVGAQTLIDLHPGNLDQTAHPQGVPEGKPYSVFASFSSAMSTSPEIKTLLTKSVSINFDWQRLAE